MSAASLPILPQQLGLGQQKPGARQLTAICHLGDSPGLSCQQQELKLLSHHPESTAGGVRS